MATALVPAGAGVEPGSCWRGTGQDSWWKLLYPDPAGGRWRALCLKAPDRYPWVSPGEERWLPGGHFGDALLPLP